MEPLFISVEWMFFAMERLFFAVDRATVKTTKLCPKLREYKSEVETGEKRWKKGVHIKRENKPSLPISRVCQNSWKINRLWKVRENLYP